jgi:hypothetical protein
VMAINFAKKIKCFSLFFSFAFCFIRFQNNSQEIKGKTSLNSRDFGIKFRFFLSTFIEREDPQEEEDLTS